MGHSDVRGNRTKHSFTSHVCRPVFTTIWRWSFAVAQITLNLNLHYFGGNNSDHSNKCNKQISHICVSIKNILLLTIDSWSHGQLLTSSWLNDVKSIADILFRCAGSKVRMSCQESVLLRKLAELEQKILEGSETSETTNEQSALMPMVRWTTSKWTSTLGNVGDAEGQAISFKGAREYRNRKKGDTRRSPPELYSKWSH